MKKIAFAHLKGGVGKTTSAVTIAHLAAQDGQKTLVVDLDAQGAAARILTDSDATTARARRVARAKKSVLDDIVASKIPGLDVFAGGMAFRRLSELLVEEGDPASQMESLLKRLAKGYDTVLVDAPAGLNAESEAILTSVDLVVVPVVPSPLSLESFATLRSFMAELTDTRKKKLPLKGFFSMVDRRRGQHKQAIQTEHPGMWPVVVPNSAAVERVSIERLPLGLIKRPGPALPAYRDLWQRIAAECGLRSS